MDIKNKLHLTLKILEDLKAENIDTLNVKNLTTLMDYIIICTTNSVTHGKALANHINIMAKKNKMKIIGIEGQKTGDWIIIDLSNIVVHCMRQEIRNFYQIEKLLKIH